MTKEWRFWRDNRSYMRRAFLLLALFLFAALIMPISNHASFSSARGGNAVAEAAETPQLIAPEIASPNSILMGTAGPNGSVSLDFHETGGRTEHTTARTNGIGRFMLRAPANATSIDFRAGGAIQHCVVSSNRSLIVGGLVARRAVSGNGKTAVAIVGAQFAYDLGQPLRLQVERFNPLTGKLILDGLPTPLLAASDRSVVATVAATIPLGRHSVGIISNGHAVAVQADLVRTKLSVTGPSDYHLPKNVQLTIDGLYGDRATVTFGVGNGAVLANNREEETVPVVPTGDGGGQADTTVRANHPGTVDLQWKLNTGFGLKYNYGNYETPIPHTPPTPSPTPGVPCKIRLTDGWFEAVQGPYQDDPVFKNKPEQLLREDGNTISYFGQLDMIKGRPSLLSGVLEYSKHGVLVPVDSRNNIVMKGETNCSEYGPVKIRFTLHEHGHGPHVIYLSPIAGYVFYKGYAEQKYTPWQANVPTFNGVPTTPFTFSAGAEHYAIEAELVDDKDHSLGMSMWLNGYTEVTEGPLLRIVPLLLTHSRAEGGTQARQDSLVEDANRVKGEMFEHIPDVYPLKPHGLPMPQVGEPIDLSGKVFDTSWDDAISFDTTIRHRHQQNLQAALDDRLATTTVLQGASRTIAVLVRGDFDQLVGPGALGYTMSTKLVTVRRGQPWTTAGHEVAHTLPQFLWSSVEMQSQCELNYHNKYDPVAYGLQTMKLSQPIEGEPHYGYPLDLMQGSDEEAWISQCTYDNLITALKGPVDPLVLMVRFYLAQPVHGGVVGKLRPAYITHATLSPVSKNGKFTVIAYGGGGGVLQRASFQPQFEDENNFVRNIISVQVRLRYDPAITRIELRGDRGQLLDSLAMSRTTPTLHITRAAIRGKRVSVAWTGSGQARGALLYSVFLSHDGKVYYEFSFERPATSATFMLRKRSTFDPRFVKVVVTDGSRSSESVAPLVR